MINSFSKINRFRYSRSICKSNCGRCCCCRWRRLFWAPLAHTVRFAQLFGMKIIWFYLIYWVLYSDCILNNVGSLFHCQRTCSAIFRKAKPNRTRTHAKRLCGRVCMFQMLRVLEICLQLRTRAWESRGKAALSEFSAHQASASLSLFLLWISSANSWFHLRAVL